MRPAEEPPAKPLEHAPNRRFGIFLPRKTYQSGDSARAPKLPKTNLLLFVFLCVLCAFARNLLLLLRLSTGLVFLSGRERMRLIFLTLPADQVTKEEAAFPGSSTEGTPFMSTHSRLSVLLTAGSTARKSANLSPEELGLC